MPDIFEILDPTLIAVALVGLLVLILLLRRPAGDATQLRSTLSAKEAELRDALNGSNRFEALAGERKTETDRLNGDLSKLRTKLEDDAEQRRVTAGQISGLEADLRAGVETARAGELRHAAAIEERRLGSEETKVQLRSLLEANETKTQELGTFTNRISRLDVELHAAKEKAETTATRIAETLAELKGYVADRDGQIRTLRERLDVAATEKQGLTGTINRFQAELKAQGEASAEKIEMLSKVRADMEAKFGELAREALKIQGEAFSQTNIERLNATLTPLKEHVGHFERELKAVHQATVDDRAALKAEIQQLSKRSEDISKEALALTRALKSDHQRQGAWGEMILEGILERSGLREGEEYETQAHRIDPDGGRLRPDVVVRIPGGKSLVIDSKVSLVAYTDAVNAETDQEAATARKRHVASLRSHIVGLSEKGYQTAETSTVDYVILFVPIEGALSEALREDGAITEFALDRQITIATPTTLMMALRTVSHVWAVERRNQNAEEIARRAGLLCNRPVSLPCRTESGSDSVRFG